VNDEKLQKVLARAGYGSRRELEGWIEAGRVSVNGRTATLGDRVTETDVLRVDGHPVSERRRTARKRPRVLMYNKPAGEICARKDPEGRPTVFDALPGIRDGRWVMVGRLDFNTTGLLLFTSDGELANRLMHPSARIEREYAVRVLGEVTDLVIKNLLGGVELDDGPARFTRVEAAGGEGANQWFHVTLLEGRYREVRRLWESQDLTVSRLSRIRFGPLALPRTLRGGKWEELDSAALQLLGVKPVPAEHSRDDDDDAGKSRRQPARRQASRGQASRSKSRPGSRH
jgi:23S rRNA pseudouridine2605 synthase